MKGTWQELIWVLLELIWNIWGLFAGAYAIFILYSLLKGDLVWRERL